jgi:hypothetical protein
MEINIQIDPWQLTCGVKRVNEAGGRLMVGAGAFTFVGYRVVLFAVHLRDPVCAAKDESTGDRGYRAE